MEISNTSLSQYSSSYSACVHDVAMNETDMCIGPFWLTSERQLMSPFTGGVSIGPPLFSATTLLLGRPLSDRLLVDVHRWDFLGRV